MYIVIKIGSALLVNEDGALKKEMLEHIISGVKYLQDMGKKIIIVSSGAVAAGGQKYAFEKLSQGVKAAIGQPMLINEYSKIAQQKNIITAQYLLSNDDLSDRKRYIYLQSALEEATRHNIVPIINDNDILHGVKKSFSDNDQLACYLGIMLHAEKVLLLTSVDGIYNDFGTEKQKRIDIITKLEEFKGIQTDQKTDFGTGGMKGKIDSIRLAMQCGIDVYVGHGSNEKIFASMFDDSKRSTKPYTKIVGMKKDKQMKGIQKWLFAGAEPKGEIQISDKGGEELRNRKIRKSVLIKGIEHVFGQFSKGDVISVIDKNFEQIGYGVAKLDAAEIRSQKGEENIIVIHANYFLVTA
ncbi:TPA: glutamate 5-kinase [Candidatus Gracilibacteria bacterium]|nr:glutamate 5-kinase [Candidatus Gracilibacteria bacterium]